MNTTAKTIAVSHAHANENGMSDWSKMLAVENAKPTPVPYEPIDTSDLGILELSAVLKAAAMMGETL